MFLDQENFLKTATRPKRNPTYCTKPEGRLYSFFHSDEFFEYEIGSLKHQWEERNLISERNQLNDKSIETEISSVKTTCLIEYDNDKTLEIKDEFIQDQETADKEYNKNYSSNLCAAYIKEDVSVAVEQPRTQEQQEIQKSLEKKYKCLKCARSYNQKGSLHNHQKYECGIMPQFMCIFCGKRFKQKAHMNNHVVRLHQKTDSKTPTIKYKCDKCPRSYIWVDNLYQHKRVIHSAIRPQFICDYCGYEMYLKSSLAKHVTSRHLK